MKKVLAAISGGVDSGVVIHLLQEMGYKVIGITFKFFDEFDVSSAINVAKSFNIEHHIINSSESFYQMVVKHSWNEYKEGRTPNPCAICNRHMKFNLLYQYMQKFNCDHIATGHYAGVCDSRSKLYIKRGMDSSRDQSYFMFGIFYKCLERLIFPLGNMLKSDVKKLAAELNIPHASKESRGVCFAKDGQLPLILEEKFGSPSPGPIFDMSGKIVGQHAGIHKYTVGQRKGLGAFGNRVFVHSINPRSNSVVICSDDELFKNSFKFSNLNLNLSDIVEKTMVQIRYGHPAVPAKNVSEDSIELIEDVRAITPGQAVVFYDRDIVIGGGWIKV